VVFKECHSPGLVAITFDDGPSEYTNEILDALKSNNVKATFFVTGHKLNSNDSIITIKRIINEGHTLGSHMYTHKLISKMSDADVIREMELTSNKIFEITGWFLSYL
jgi:peptidoglycan-N-acetylglucosamine deacetylase